MWSLAPLDDVGKRYQKFEKKWQQEIVNIFNNLDILKRTLDLGTKPEQAKKLLFVRSLPLGLLEIDQKGPNRGAKLVPFRLYVYPHEESETLYLITLGDKSTQSKNIQQAKSFVQELLQRVQSTGPSAKEGNENKQE